MIVKKTWKRVAHETMFKPELRYHYTGWFLFGIIPLYIIRRRTL